MHDLSGRTAFVTGAAGDIGRAICVAIAEAGASIVAVDRLPADEATKLHGVIAHERLHYVKADVTDRAAMADAISEPDRLDIVIGNAGIVEGARYVDVTPESWQRQMDVNLTGNFHVTQLALRRFVREGTRGSIVLTGSWVGERPWPEIAPYSATKAALQMLVRSIALEHAKDAIRCNLVAPGIVNAGMARAYAERDPEYARKAAEAVPLGSLQRPEDIASVVLFLSSDAAVNVTGASYLVDGGASLGRF